MMRIFSTAGVLLAVCPLMAADMSARKVDPTFLHRYIPDVPAQDADATCRYKPIFGAGDSQPGILRGVVRFGEITVLPGGACKPVSYPAEEQAYVITEGSGTLTYGSDKSPVKKNDFMYLPAGIEHGVSNSGTTPVRFFVMGFKVPPGTPPPAKLQIASIDEIKTQLVGGHPDSVVYQLMMGDTTSKRDRLATGHLLVSLYVMTF
jgi:quercetin dioxygenase-like cupin family protein